MERLHTLKLRLTFEENYDQLEKQLQLIHEACDFLYQSKHIKNLLEVCFDILSLFLSLINIY